MNIFRSHAGAMLAAGLLLGLTASAAPADGAERAGRCESLRIEVALTPGTPAADAVAATLCRPFDPSPRQARGEVDLLVHGATYGGVYWDWPAANGWYSYVDRTLRSGRPVLFYDRVGTGASSHPVSTAIDFRSDAFVMHQLVQWLRRRGFEHVNAIAHSLGSMIAAQEAGTYRDVDRLVLTGFRHRMSAAGLTAAASALYPANLDAQFKGLSLDSGYLTSVPGERKTLFYAGLFQPAEPAYDELHKDAVTASEMTDMVTLAVAPPATNVSTRITAPTLLVLGQEDFLFCEEAAPCTDSLLAAAEAPYFPNVPRLGVRTVPQTGHDLALHLTADASFGFIDRWLAIR